MSDTFNAAESYARELDRADPVRSMREQFCMPRDAAGQERPYFCGNSLGLQPLGARSAIEHELDAWAELAVDGHFKEHRGWYRYHELFREPLGRIVGAKPSEVVVMNSLTANLHLMMVSFYQPTSKRHKILIEESAFPSDSYAVQSQLRFHGFDPQEGMLVARARPGETTVRTSDMEQLIADNSDEIALVMISGVQYYTGQAFEIPRIAKAAKKAGCMIGLDLAHAAGNLDLRLHDWDIDFAVWCSYKYLNAGPGAVAGAFVHERHGEDLERKRFAGWWGNDPERRFRMHLESQFVPISGADGWQLSNPPILAMTPLLSSLELFDQVPVETRVAKARALTGYLESWVKERSNGRVKILTPSDPTQRGSQLSLYVPGGGRQLFKKVEEAGIVADYREPDVVRVAPVPLYNSFHDVWCLGHAIESWAEGLG